MSTTEVALDYTAIMGFTSKKRYRRWVDESMQYPDAIPVDEVRERVFFWNALEGGIVAFVEDDDGETTWYPDPTRMAVVRSDLGTILGVHGMDSYKVHPYQEWLLDTVVPILDNGLGIGLAATIRGGAVAAVSVEMPENIVTPEGVEFRPHLLATTSHDSSVATSYHRGVTVFGHPMAAGIAKRVVGGNPMAPSRERFAIRHTRNSYSRFKDTLAAVKVIEDIVADFQEEITELVCTDVNDRQLQAFFDLMYPLPDEDGRKRTLAMNRQAALGKLLREDDRVSPWSKTAWGILLAVNIANHELGIVRGDRDERNLTNLVYGSYVAQDQKALKLIQEVL